VEVRTIRIDDEISAERLPVPAVIKIDVEGAEADVLNGARQTLITHKPYLLVAIHGTPVLRVVETILKECDYQYRVECSGDSGMYEIYARSESASSAVRL
jgi:hypothetical protein